MKKRNKLYLLNKLTIVAIAISFFQSCNKKSELESSNGEITLSVSTSVENFNDGGIKKQASAKEPESFSNNMEFNKEFLMISTLSPITENTEHTTNSNSNNNSNRADLQTSELDTDEVYKLIIYNADGSYRTYRNYTHGKENLTPALPLPANRSYTFIAYSLNNKNIADLDNVFTDSTVTLSQAKIIINNNPDLLIYKQNLSVTENSKHLGIIFKHQFNEITTIIDVSATGYSIDASSLQTRFNIPKNTATITFANMGQVNSANGGFQTDLNGTSAYSFSSFSGVSNSIATSKSTTLVNTDNNTSLFSVRNIKIGTVTNSILNPFSTGVTLIPGYKYRLEVKIVPRDRTLQHGGKPAVLLGGQVWMRYNLGSNGDLQNQNGDNADTPGSNIHGAYYQWGEQQRGIFANATSPNAATWRSTGLPYPTDFTIWNKGTDTAPVKGAKDPCPANYRLPTKQDFTTLINYIPNELRQFKNSYNTVNYILQFTSKYNANAKLTFPASGFGYMNQNNDGGQYNVGFGSMQGRYQQVHLKTSYYGSATRVSSTGSPSGYSYKTLYMLYSPVSGTTTTSKIIIYPSATDPRVSASVNAHPVRCIAINSVAAIISMNERENNSGGDKNIDY